MSLYLRQRGRLGTWFARGTVRIGKQTVTVAEFSTGTTSRRDAEAAAGAEEARIRADFAAGPEAARAKQAARLTIADCLDTYVSRPGGIRPYDQDRVAALNDAIGGRLLSDAAEAWGAWQAAHPGHAPATAARWRAILMAALAAGAKAHAQPVPTLPTIRQPRADRTARLTEGERKRLLASYSPHAAAPVLVMCYQGLRSSEAIHLDWRDVFLEPPGEEYILIPAEETKSGDGRQVELHPRVVALLVGLWKAAGQPESGPVFLSRRGKPYSDTRGRGERVAGGNPLSKAHETACRLAGVSGFRLHDWRHDWAARMVMQAGADLHTLQDLGGWKSPRMVSRYASLTREHRRGAIRRLA